MDKSRLEAFNDAILAIIMTVTVLQLVAPKGSSFQDLVYIRAHFAIYFISFFAIAVYWVNHHHMMQLVEKVTGGVLWSNIAMLFFISLTPFAISWMLDSNMDDLAPGIFYGTIFLLVDISYGLIFMALKKTHGQDTKFHMVYDDNQKILISLIVGAIILPLGYFSVKIIFIGRLLIPFMWAIPSKHAEVCAEDDESCCLMMAEKKKRRFFR